MNKATTVLFDEFAAAYRGGETPDVLAYLQRAGGDADALADLIDRFLRATPARESTEEEIVLAHARTEQEPPLLALRIRRRLTRDAVVGALVSALGIDLAKSAKVRRYYSDLEVGVLAPEPVDGSVWDALAEVLRANVRVLAGLRPPPPAAAASAYMRAASGIELYERMSSFSADVEPSADDDRDEVDRLFTGIA